MIKKLKTRRVEVEWICGAVVVPTYVMDEDVPFQPEVLMWMNSEGMVIGSTMMKQGELPSVICEHLNSVIEAPIGGRPEVPTRIRVASAELADALRAGRADIEIVHAETPEIDEALAGLKETLVDGVKDAAPSYLFDGISDVEMASFFRATAGLFRVSPWKMVSTDTALLSITVEALGVRDQVLSVIGQDAESMGLVLFSDMAQFDAYLDAAYANEHGEGPVFPPHLVLNYDRGADIPVEMRKEIVKYGWEVAGADAYPWVMSIVGAQAARAPTPDDFLLFEVIARALTELISSEAAALRTAGDGEPVSRTCSVSTYKGDFEVTLRAPYSWAEGRLQASGTIEDLFEFSRFGGQLDTDVRDELEVKLIESFLSSPEARGLSEIGACEYVMDFAHDYFRALITTIHPFELEEIVFGLIPRKVTVASVDAALVIDDLRRFYAFMERAFGYKRAKACLRVLGGDAVERLEAALSDRGHFGLAKSIMMGGAEAGFDVHTLEGAEAWMKEISGKPLPDSVRLPAHIERRLPTRISSAAKVKKRKRKVKKSAQKKNRKK